MTSNLILYQYCLIVTNSVRLSPTLLYYVHSVEIFHTAPHTILHISTIHTLFYKQTPLLPKIKFIPLFIIHSFLSISRALSFVYIQLFKKKRKKENLHYIYQNKIIILSKRLYLPLLRKN